MTGQYAVIGNPIGHSKSPAIHLAFAAQVGQNLSYVLLEAPQDGFAAKVDAFRAQGGLGLNITAPFKLDAFRYATSRLESARLAGAANAMAFDGDQVVASNFDGVGLLRDIEVNLGVALAGKRVLLLGAGGATRGALLPFLQARPAEVVVANRTLAKATALAQEFAGHGALAALGYAELGGQGAFDVVVNGTSASLFGELPPVPESAFAPGGLAYEMAYGKKMTPFLHRARDSGVRHLADGVGMLVEQAAEAFAWWRGVRPRTAEVIAKMTVKLE